MRGRTTHRIHLSLCCTLTGAMLLVQNPYLLPAAHRLPKIPTAEADEEVRADGGTEVGKLKDERSPLPSVEHRSATGQPRSRRAVRALRGRRALCCSHPCLNSLSGTVSSARQPSPAHCKVGRETQLDVNWSSPARKRLLTMSGVIRSVHTAQRSQPPVQLLGSPCRSQCTS